MCLSALTCLASTASELARKAEHEAADEPSPAAFRQAADLHRASAAANRVAATECASTGERARYVAKALEHDRLAAELERAASR